jgi:hypothetical protein
VSNQADILPEIDEASFTEREFRSLIRYSLFEAMMRTMPPEIQAIAAAVGPSERLNQMGIRPVFAPSVRGLGSMTGYRRSAASGYRTLVLNESGEVIGFARRGPGLGSWASSFFSDVGGGISNVWNDTVGRVVDSIYNETIRTWKRTWTEAERVGNRVGDEIERTFDHIADAGFWQDRLQAAFSEVERGFDRTFAEVERTMQRSSAEAQRAVAHLTDPQWYRDTAQVLSYSLGWTLVVSLNDVWEELKRFGNRAQAEIARTGRNLGSQEWWINTVARGIARVAAIEILVAIVSFVFPPLAIVLAAMDAFIASYGSAFMSLAWGAATSPAFYAYVFPDETNAFLGETVKAMNKLDIFQTLPTLALTELTIQAQTSREKRDGLRLEIAMIQAKYANTGWVIIARAVFEVVQAVVITIVTFGAGAIIVAAIEAAKLAMSAATTLLQLQMMRETTRIVERQVAERRAVEEQRRLVELHALEVELEALRKEIADLGGVPEIEVATVEQALGLTGADLSAWSLDRRFLDPGIQAILIEPGAAPSPPPISDVLNFGGSVVAARLAPCCVEIVDILAETAPAPDQPLVRHYVRKPVVAPRLTTRTMVKT